MGEFAIFSSVKETKLDNVNNDANQPVNREDNLAVPMGIHHILIVDDENMVAEVASAHLKTAGYQVSIHMDSTSALGYFNENHSAISLVIIDMIMPEMDGPTLYRAIKAIAPQMPIILSSGFSLDSAAQTLLDDGANAFLQKPFRRATLLDTVSAVLEA